MPRRSAKAAIKQRALNGNFAMHLTITLTMLVSAMYYNTELHRALVEWQILYIALFFSSLCIGVSAFYLANTSNPGFVCPEEQFSIKPQGLTAKQIEEHFEWCKICLLARPVRAKHCFVCKRCVRKFDHHCPYIGRCIGERNHGYFLIATLVNGALALFSVVLLYPLLPRGNRDGMENLTNASVLMLSFVLSVIGSLGFGMIGIMHFYLVSSGITTWEFVRRKRIRYLREYQYGNPFDEGFFRNIYKVLTQPMHAARDWAAMLPSADLHRGDHPPSTNAIEDAMGDVRHHSGASDSPIVVKPAVAVDEESGSASPITRPKSSTRRGALDVSATADAGEIRTSKKPPPSATRSSATLATPGTGTHGGSATTDEQGKVVSTAGSTTAPSGMIAESTLGGDAAGMVASTDEDDFVDVGKEAPLSFRKGRESGSGRNRW
eukprot:m.456700 g.456700  ORF g.456700 m.456700 type:complete len:435 (+) comp21575_c0_seq1:257-1561(+)